MQHDEARIINECQNGNLKQFGLLYDAYAQKIYRFIYYKTHHTGTAEDLTSIAFMKVLEGIGSFNPNKGTFSSWLYQIARNTVTDHWRKAKPTVDIEDVWDLTDDTDIVRDVDIAMKSKQVRAAMAALQPRQREIITLRLWQDLSYKEIAEITGSTEGAAKMLFSRTVKELRETMPLAAFLSLLLLK